ncbi:hypothetical protein ROHU_004487 [Labeo rohita]|uniref:Fucolectin tachylectin-4 pentraxin-1 domain-containing protein n=1 Tax=Labeo rohita TaxID=84645 RepID=A0A498NM37_LABRO|nr:hypothetical protein ROHU_004487 [Labeo rohita]
MSFKYSWPIVLDDDQPWFTDTTIAKAKNLALYGKATQSDLIKNPWSGEGHASNAIDGNHDPDFHHGSCTATDLQNDPWWKLDLLDEYVVTSITITNRNEVPERLDGAEIHIGNSLLSNGNSNPLAGKISSIPGGRSLTFEWKKGISGRYINVVIPGSNRLLTLCEVEVYGYPAPDGENVALKGKATQNLLLGNNFASNAIDGNKDGDVNHGSCTQTEKTLNPWWRLDLLKRHKVFSVVITNRVDFFSVRLNGAEIRIGNSLDNNGNNNPRTMKMHVFFLLCISMMPWFTDTTIAKDKNLALYGKATQSDLIKNPWSGEGHASNAIDGNRDPDYYHGSCTATDLQNDPWWRAGKISSIPGGRSLTFEWKKGISGRYISVVIPGSNRLLTLCEVEVYGYPAPDGENVALKGKATQNLLLGNNFASNAIDGNKDGDVNHGSCSQTEKTLNPWWRLDLLKRHKVFSVVITNRVDFFSVRLNGAEIRIGNSLDNNGNNNPR